MSKSNDGGPAFACAAENGHQPGMTLRDYFAGQVIFNTHVGVGYTDARCKEAAAVLARRAYIIAEAMLAEREKRS